MQLRGSIFFLVQFATILEHRMDPSCLIRETILSAELMTDTYVKPRACLVTVFGNYFFVFKNIEKLGKQREKGEHVWFFYFYFWKIMENTKNTKFIVENSFQITPKWSYMFFLKTNLKNRNQTGP